MTIVIVSISLTLKITNDMDSLKNGFVMSVANALRRYNSLSSDVRLFIACQFALESDYGRSRIAARNTNYCGMKVPALRLSTAINKGVVDSVGDFAKYNSFADCVLDYVLWLQYNKIPSSAQTDLEAFERFLHDSKYCPALDYLSRIEAIYKQFK